MKIFYACDVFWYYFLRIGHIQTTSLPSFKFYTHHTYTLYWPVELAHVIETTSVSLIV